MLHHLLSSENSVGWPFLATHHRQAGKRAPRLYPTGGDPPVTDEFVASSYESIVICAHESRPNGAADQRQTNTRACSRGRLSAAAA